MTQRLKELEARRVFDLGHPPPVLSKADFVRRYARGEFGNCSPTYQTVKELLDVERGHDYRFPKVSGLYHLRNRIAGGATYYNLEWSDCIAKWREQVDRSAWYVSAMAPEDKKIMQGEVMRTTGGLYLNYNLLPLPMREGMAKESRHATGIMAISLLRGRMCPNSWEWLNVLLDRYPDHVVEFSTYSVPWGTLYPLFNTCFWEVRRY